jgi:hypothetical protein
MKLRFILIAAIILLLPAFNGVLMAAPIYGNVSTFKDKSAEKTIIFTQDGDSNKTVFIDIPYKAVVTNASFDVVAVFNATDQYSNNPKIDVGADGDTDWAYSGMGYGRFGNQNLFDDNIPERGLYFKENETYRTDMRIKLPKNATVSFATLNITGRGIAGGVPTKGHTTYASFNSSMKNIPRNKKANFNTHPTGNLQSNFYTGIGISNMYTSAGSVMNSSGPGQGNTGGAIQGEGLHPMSPLLTNLGPFSTFKVTFTQRQTGAGFMVVDKWTGGGMTLKGYTGTNGTGTLITTVTAPNSNYQKNNMVFLGVTDGNSTIKSIVWYIPYNGGDVVGIDDIEFGAGYGGGNENVTIDVGDNGGTPEFNYTGKLNSSVYLQDFSSELNSLLSSSPVTFVDDYGIEFVDISLNITNNKSGMVYLSELDIRYNLTLKAYLNPHNSNLINELNELIPDSGEGNISIPIKIYSGSQGQIKITNISIDYYIPNLTNDRLLISNGHGPANICYADHKNYIFMVNVTDLNGRDNIENVTLILDSDAKQIGLNWEQATGIFTEEEDLNDYITLDIASCSATPISLNSWSVRFVVRFNWTYPTEAYERCAVNTTNNTNAWVLTFFEEVYRVENDLDFTGTLTATGQFQGALSNGGWVRSSETITWSGLKVVYQGTTNIYPDDKNFNITLRDDDSDTWKNYSSSGRAFKIKSTSDPTSDYSDLHQIDITQIPGFGQDISSITFLIKTDNDKPTVPLNILCHADSATDVETTLDNDLSIHVTWDPANDGAGSGVGAYAMDYNKNPPTSIKSSGDSAQGAEGVATFYVRARDKVGNWGSVGSDSINIDVTDLTFTDAFPDEETWFNTRSIQCGILISDLGGSGVNNDTIYYRYVEKGSVEYGEWRKFRGAPPSAESVQCNKRINFETDGAFKKIQWRAQDIAGNIVTQPGYHVIKIDSTPANFEGFNIDFNKWYYSKSMQISYYVNDSLPENDECSGVDENSIFYQISTTGPDDYGDWVSVTPTSSGTEFSKKCYITPTFEEGTENYIRFRGIDKAGNMGISEDYNIKIDGSPPEFLNPTPTAKVWVNYTKIQCNISIIDPASKVDVSTVKYCISTNGTENYDKWCKVGVKHLGDSLYSSVTLTMNETFDEGANNYIRWQATDSAGNIAISEDYQIRVDSIGCEFSSPSPATGEWLGTDSLLCSLVINETGGAGIDVESIEYATSTSSGDSYDIRSWKNIGLLKTELVTSDQGIVYSIRVQVAIKAFNEGTNNYIYWRAKDLAGNGYDIGGPYRVLIDLSPLDFFNPKPRPDSVQIELEQTCKITIIDNEGGSGVDPDSVEYRYSTVGKTGYSDWSNEGISYKLSSGVYQFIVYVNFHPGKENQIQWRATDLAGIGPIESQWYQVIINSAPTPVITSPTHDPAKEYDYTDADEITFDAKQSLDLDADMLTYFWESNITGALGGGMILKRELPPGNHKITLYANDGHTHNVSTHVNITVGRFFMLKDFDGDGIPDVDDPDTDNDDYKNENDAFPFNKKEWLDTDFDGVGNNADDDDDDDGHPDEEDDYPLDASRWKKKAPDYSWAYISSALIGIILILLIGFFVFKRHSRKQKAKAEEQRLAAQTTTGAGVGAAQPTTAAAMRPLTTPQQITGIGQGQIPMAHQFQAGTPIPMLPPASTAPRPYSPVQYPGQAQLSTGIPQITPQHPYTAVQQPQQPPVSTIQIPGQVPQPQPQPQTQQPQVLNVFKCPSCDASILNAKLCNYCGWKE